MAEMRDLLKEMSAEIPGFEAAAVVGMDGLAIAEYRGRARLQPGDGNRAVCAGYEIGGSYRRPPQERESRGQPGHHRRHLHPQPVVG